MRRTRTPSPPPHLSVAGTHWLTTRSWEDRLILQFPKRPEPSAATVNGVRGVFPATATAAPPAGSQFVDIQDRHGTVILSGWVHPQFTGHAQVLEHAYQLLDELDDPSVPVVYGVPRLMR